jgi:hypothetical protein
MSTQKSKEKTRRKRRKKMGKFKINSQIQPFDFEISCSKCQKERVSKRKSYFLVILIMLHLGYACVYIKFVFFVCKNKESAPRAEASKLLLAVDRVCVCFVLVFY